MKRYFCIAFFLLFSRGIRILPSGPMIVFVFVRLSYISRGETQQTARQLFSSGGSRNPGFVRTYNFCFSLPGENSKVCMCVCMCFPKLQYYLHWLFYAKTCVRWQATVSVLVVPPGSSFPSRKHHRCRFFPKITEYPTLDAGGFVYGHMRNTHREARASKTSATSITYPPKNNYHEQKSWSSSITMFP